MPQFWRYWLHTRILTGIRVRENRSPRVDYDTNGRLTTRPGSGGTAYFGYDYAGRVVSMTLGSGLTLTYGLDGDGRLLREVRGGENVYYLLDGRNALKESTTQRVTVTSSDGTPATSIAVRPRDLDRL